MLESDSDMRWIVLDMRSDQSILISSNTTRGPPKAHVTPDKPTRGLTYKIILFNIGEFEDL